MKGIFKRNKRTTTKVAIVLTTALALILAQLPVVNTANAEETSDLVMTAAGLITTTTTEYGPLAEGLDKDGNHYVTVKSNTVGKERETTIISYSTNPYDYDVIVGTDSYSYRWSDKNNVVTIIERANGNVVCNKTGEPSSNGEILVTNYGRVVESHYYNDYTWEKVTYDLATNTVTGALTKEIVPTSTGYGTVVTKTTGSGSMPTAAPTTAPTATPYHPWWYTPTPTPYRTTPPLPSIQPATPTPVPTVAPVPTAAPVQTVAPVPTQKPVIVTPDPVDNSKPVSALSRSTKIEQKAYKSLKRIDKKAKQNGWGVRKYTRRLSSKNKVITVVFLKGYAGFKDGEDQYLSIRFRHVEQRYKGNKFVARYRWKGKWVSQSEVYKVIRSLGK